MKEVGGSISLPPPADLSDPVLRTVMDETWTTIERLCAWLDEESPVQGRTGRLLRILKVGEEYGEVAAAVHGLLGSNPRKGRTHTIDDICEELCDVIVTSMVALASISDDAGDVFSARLREIARRSLE